MSKSKYDRSSVTQLFEGVDTFDGALQGKWLFQPVEDNLPDQVFDTEEEACAAQRAHREQRGYDPITGESASPTYAMIYDITDIETGHLIEAYYGFFNSVEDAKKQFARLYPTQKLRTLYRVHNARVVQVIETVIDCNDDWA